MTEAEVLALKFEPGEEVQAADLKRGEWYIFSSNGYGYPDPLPFQVQDEANHLVVYPNAKPTLQPMRIPFKGFTRPENYPASYGYRFKLSRAIQQPDLPAETWKYKNLANLASNIFPTTGTDPEIFAEDAAGNIIPAWEFLDSKKTSPGMFWDGFQAEFTVNPGGCQDGVASAIYHQLKALSSKLPVGARLSTRSVVEVSRGALRSATAEHVDFGCRPSLNAYGLAGEAIADPRDCPIRFAGGHIHWGLNRANIKDFEAMAVEGVKFVDLVTGLIGVSIFEGMDDPRRRRYYGLAGEYRLPPHGIEYRVLSNAWLTHPAVYHLLFTLGRMALRLGLAGHLSDLRTVPEIAVVNAINNTDVARARQLLAQQSRLLEAMVSVSFGPNAVAPTMRKILTPVSTWGIDTSRILDNWTPQSWGYPQRWRDFCEKGPEPPAINRQANTLEASNVAVAPPAAVTTAVSNVPGRPKSVRSRQPKSGL